MEPTPPLYELVSNANTAIDEEVIDKAVARIDYARQKTGRSCGSCSMCCYVMGSRKSTNQSTDGASTANPERAARSTVTALRPAKLLPACGLFNCISVIIGTR